MRAQGAGDADVVIVGAGLAGLSAAIELTRAGLQVLLLEAAERPGGRIVTDFVDAPAAGRAPAGTAVRHPVRGR
ncbi:MAG TPA: FAD-dependent oxidoreductase [Jatrophihabitans sp.]|jgi:monoamine oxidase|uniref:FAD-dependent oxidoreductase n=1 Tax=Jatrophihabitans sp. TaxID=1932789 RepID=UPI002EFABE73